SRVEVAEGETVLVRGWPGAGVSLALAGLLLAAILGADGLRDRLGSHTFGWRQPLVALLAVVAAAGPVVVLGSWAVDARADRPGIVGERQIEALSTPLVPAVGRQAQQGGQSARVLVLAPLVATGASGASGVPGTSGGSSEAGGAAGTARDGVAVRWQLLRGD